VRTISLYVAAAAIIAMFFIESRSLAVILAAAALVLSIAACVMGMKASPEVSPLTNVAKKVLYPASVLLALLFIFFHYLNLSYYQIPQNGMFPGTPAGSRLFAKRNPYNGPSDVLRGDIVVFTRTENGNQYTYIWRVVGLPGDVLQTMGDSLVVNGQELEREQARDDGDFVIYREANGSASYEVAYGTIPPSSPPADATITVPPEHFFVVGDNRHNARDSRYFGPIPFESIIAKKW
jgi:signal peptidase I